MDTDLTRHLATLLDPADAPRRAIELLRRLGSARRLGIASTATLTATGLVSPSEALRIHSAFTLASAALALGPADPLDSPAVVARAVPELWTSPVEELWLVAVDAGLRPASRELVARGGPASCVVPPADILRRVLVSGATGMFLLHNHPSGDPTPSRRDRRFTAEVGRRAADLELQLHDHLVIAGLAWASCSTAEAGAILATAQRPSRADLAA